MSQENSTIETEKVLTVEDNKTVSQTDLSSNVINRFFGLFENILGGKDFFTQKDVNSLQNTEVKEVVKNELQVADNSDSVGDSVPSTQTVSDTVESSSDKLDRVVPSFPSPTPVASDSSEVSTLERFRELYSESPRKASRYFEENSKEILKDVVFF